MTASNIKASNAVNYWSHIVASNGITVSSGVKVSYESGYQVATREGLELINEDLGILLLTLDILDIQNYGIWRDGANWCADTNSIYEKDYDKAMQIAKDNDQKAIYNWADGNSIEVK